MGRKKKLQFSVVLLVLLFAGQAVAGWFGGAKKNNDSTTMPAFELTELPENDDFSSERLRGKVVLVNFWATWCGPCVAEYPDLMKLHTTYGDQGFSVIGISMDQSAGSVKTFMKKAGAVYPMLMGNSSISRAFKAGSGLPMSFLVDRKGAIVKKYYGPRSFEEFARDIEPFL